MLNSFAVYYAYLKRTIVGDENKFFSGRYEEDFIEHRKNILQIWVNKVCRHPVLSKSDVWIHFVTCTDEKKWKTGKRKAEKDEYVGGNFLYSITVPSQPLDSSDVYAVFSFLFFFFNKIILFQVFP